MTNLKAIYIIFLLFLLCVQSSLAGAQTILVRPVDERDPRNPNLIVFVHGITSDARYAWTNGDSNNYWPMLVKEDDTFFGADIIAYDYPSSYWGNGLGISDLAAKFLKDLRSEPVNADAYENIVFVAHSMGGLIVRQALLQSEKLREKTPAIFTFATPSGGSSLATLLDFFSSNQAVRDLKRAIDQSAGDPDNFLVNLRNSWRNQRMARKTWSYCAFETIGTTKWLVFTAIPVDKLSAELLCDSGLTGVAANHSDIVRPYNEYSHQHRQLASWYTDVFPDADRARRGEEKGQIVIARCSTDHYGEDLYATLSSEVLQLVGSPWRFTRELPQNWRTNYLDYIWQIHPPEVLIIHYSCFQQGEETNEGRAEAITDFHRMLGDLRESGVRVVAFSRGFVEYPTFGRDQLASEVDIQRHYLGECRRAFFVPVASKTHYATNNKLRSKFRSAVRDALGSYC